MNELFTIQVATQQNETTVLTLEGRLDAAAAHDLRIQCLELADSGCRKLVLDLGGVPFVASSGLGTFLLVNETMKSSAGVLVLAAVPRTVSEVLSWMNIDRFFTFAETAEEACRSADELVT